MTKDTIIVLSDREKVRQRPGMYIGDNGRLGMNTITREIIDNAVDEYPNYPDPSKPIIVTLHEDDSLTVRDYGRGISPYESTKHPGKIEERLAYTLIGAGGKFEANRASNGNTFSGGLNGTGSSATNFMSEYFDVTIYRDGKIFHDRFENGGIPVVELKNGKLPSKKQTKPFETGTEVTFKADPTVMKVATVDSDALDELFKQIAYLHHGLHVLFKNERDGDQDFTDYYSKNGLLDYMNDLAQDSEATFLIKPFTVSGEGNDDDIKMQANIAFGMTKNEMSETVAFTNGEYNRLGGKHVDGFYDGLLRLLRHYWNEFKTPLTAKYRKKIDLILKVEKAQDLGKLFKKRMLTQNTFVIIDFKHSNPILAPQTKDELVSPEAKKAVSEIFYVHAIHHLDRHVRSIQTILGDLIEQLYEKAKDDDDSAKINKKEAKLYVSTKLAAARNVGKGKGAELILVEGDSAAGSLKSNRDANYQAILPLRGKVLNVQKSTLSRALANNEITTIFSVLGAGYGKNYDEKKLQYDKVIICTDADVDGAHISVLLQTLFLKYMPDLMKNGHVYRMLTPLFVDKLNDGSEFYAYNDAEQEKFLAKNRGKLKEVHRNKGLGELKPKQVIETILTPSTRRLERIDIKDQEKADDLTNDLMGTNVYARKELFSHDESEK